MKLYNRALMRRRMDSERRQITPDRDAVVWNIDTSSFYCLVKIQGSNKTIKAHYPRNWKTRPTWLKEGNAVRIRHRSGVQGFIEVIGHGRAIPSPVEGDSLPIPPTLTDTIISGMDVIEYEGGGMNIRITDGTYQIDGTIYSFTMPITGYIVMDDPAPMTMGEGLEMGWGDTVTPISIAAAPAVGSGRYDLISIDETGTVTVITGTVTSLTTEPPKPSLPSGHVLIGYLFIYGGMTSIPADWIGVSWWPPAPGEVATASAWKTGNDTFEFPWNGGDDTPSGSIAFTIKDQYGNNINISRVATITMLMGTGYVSNDNSTWGSSASKMCTTGVTFYYQRNQIAGPEISPILQISFVDHSPLTRTVPIICLDVSGDPV